MMQDNIFVIIGCLIMAGVCIGVQRYIKTLLDARQYGYFRDIVLAAA